MEIQEKDQLIDHLRRDIKLTKMSEMETELQQYVDECNRLRSMLEEALLDGFNSKEQQVTKEIQENQSMEDRARIEEAFYEKEVELQRERETKHSLENRMQHEKEEKDKMIEKIQNCEKKLRKVQEIMNENKRKQKIINDKNKEL